MCNRLNCVFFFQVKIPPESCTVSIPDDMYSKACVYTTEEAIASCQVVGYPAMIKASWGGGGKGIRKVCFMKYKLSNYPLLILMSSILGLSLLILVISIILFMVGFHIMAKVYRI